MNRLASERSPYLLQHANNPVDWYPWGEEAFQRARSEDKPIFLSVGYSTCHWCHVMERESFESEQIAAVLNRDFIPVKVDREERPDIDRVYMTFVQASTGSGGWPMSVWLTPDLKPFFGGTYFPPSSRWGRPGFVEVLGELARAWREERQNVVQSADRVLQQLQTFVRSTAEAIGEPKEGIPGTDVLQAGVRQFASTFDPRYGGFGGAPKFPRPSELLFLLREHIRTGDPQAREMALVTMRAMSLGGMRDHIGGGFHRYSVDEQWRVPHFEKMLYDQAQLIIACVEAAQAAGDPFFAGVADDTIEYVARDLRHPEGGFFSAEDADSVPPERVGEKHPEKAEGAFYIWRDDELRGLLGSEFDVFALRFGVEPGGNALNDPQQEFTGRNLLYVARSLEEVAQQTGRSVEAVLASLERARRMVFEARTRRPRPHLDDKVLTAWNGLMIAACARAARGPARLAEDGRDATAKYLALAQDAARFVLKNLWDAEQRLLLRRFREGDAAIEAYSEDHAYLVMGLLELFQSDGDPLWLETAINLQEQQDSLFWDPNQAGWFSTSGRDPSVLLRLKEDYDGAEPAASSVSVHNLLTIAHLTGDPATEEKIERVFARVGPDFGRLIRAVPFLASALSAWHAGMQQVVIVGDRAAEGTRALHDELSGHYLPFAVVVPVQPGERQQHIARLAPFVKGMTMREGRATAYVCRDFTCREPVNDPSGLRLALAGST